MSESAHRKQDSFSVNGCRKYDEKAIKAAEDAGCTITYLTKEQSAKFQSVAEPINEKVSAKYMTIIRKIKAAQ